MKPLVLTAFLLGTLCAQPADPWKALNIIEGTWQAKSSGAVASSGLYSFHYDLKRHVMSRISKTDAGCRGPQGFDCEHGDLLYIYQEAPDQALKAIYFDNEGHVIHYDVSTPSPSTVLFLSDDRHPGPQFRLLYERKDVTLAGKFQMRMPGDPDWKSYLEWSGPKQ